MLSIGQRIANELNVQEWQVKAAVDLLDGGSTVPFIARYRKEVTDGLDDTQLRNLAERLVYLREMEARGSQSGRTSEKVFIERATIEIE